MSRLSMYTQKLQALFSLFSSGNMIEQHPPQRDVRPIEALKPPTALLHHLTMTALIDERNISVQRSPQREVKQDKFVVVGVQAGGIFLWGLQTPDKARATIRQRVNAVQFRYKSGHQWIAKRCQHT